MTDSVPRISVIMAVYREPIEWIRSSIDSILVQTFDDFEFVIVCDAPDYKECVELLQIYNAIDERIVLLINKKNLGLTKSLNKALEKARGKYIARMDADDVSMPNRFKEQYLYMENHSKVIVLGSQIKYIGNVPRWKQTDSIKYNNDDIKAQLLFGNCIVHPTVMIRKEVLDKKHIRYDEGYRHSQDYRLWEQLKDYGDFLNLKDVLLEYRVSEQQITSTNKTSQCDLSKNVSLRLQKQWFEKSGYNFTIEELECEPSKILKRIKQDQCVTKTKEFRAYIQFVYLNLFEDQRYILSFILEDWKYMTCWNIIRYLRKALIKK